MHFIRLKIIQKEVLFNVILYLGTVGKPIPLLANYFLLEMAPSWTLYQYVVDFNPPIDSKKMKGALLASHQNLIGDVRAFDGSVLFLPRRLPDNVSIVRKNNSQYLVIQ